MESDETPNRYPYLISVRGGRPVPARKDGDYYVCAYPVFLGLWWSPREVRVLRAPCVGRCAEAPVAVVGQNAISHATAERVLSAAERETLRAQGFGFYDWELAGPEAARLVFDRSSVPTAAPKRGPRAGAK